MNHLKKMLTALGGFAAVVLGASPAFATGTTADTNITNTASVSYSVGSVAQTAVTSNTDDFEVDRKVVIDVVASDSVTTIVGNGQLQAVTTFTVTNLSNAVLDLRLVGANLSTGTTMPNGGANDSFDVSNFQYYYESNGTPGLQTGAGGDTIVLTSGADRYLDAVGVDAVNAVTVYVLGDIPSGNAAAAKAGVSLTAIAHNSTAAGSLGTAAANTAGANTANVVDTVFADLIGTDDANNDGRDSARDDYTIASALTVAKTSRVISDPINNTTNPKAIPGATVEYCIAVTAGNAAATSVNITDAPPPNTTYVAGSVRVGVTVAGGVCAAGGTAGTFTAPNVTGTIATLAAGTTLGLAFQVTIN